MTPENHPQESQPAPADPLAAPAPVDASELDALKAELDEEKTARLSAEYALEAWQQVNRDFVSTWKAEPVPMSQDRDAVAYGKGFDDWYDGYVIWCKRTHNKPFDGPAAREGWNAGIRFYAALATPQASPSPAPDLDAIRHALQVLKAKCSDGMQADWHIIANAECAFLKLRAALDSKALDGSLSLPDAQADVLLEALEDAFEAGRGMHLARPEIMSKAEAWRLYEGKDYWLKSYVAAPVPAPNGEALEGQ